MSGRAESGGAAHTGEAPRFVSTHSVSGLQRVSGRARCRRSARPLWDRPDDSSGGMRSSRRRQCCNAGRMQQSRARGQTAAASPEQASEQSVVSAESGRLRRPESACTREPLDVIKATARSAAMARCLVSVTVAITWLGLATEAVVGPLDWSWCSTVRCLVGSHPGFVRWFVDGGCRRVADEAVRVGSGGR